MNKNGKITNYLFRLIRRLPEQKGNTIAYVAMILIIFGVIGAVMASLLASSITSTASPNHSRRALYMTEAGMRYGLSELRNSGFSTSVVNDLNTKTYTISSGETFTLNIFGLWYESGTDQSISGGGDLTLNVTTGKIPQEFSIPANIWIVNLDFIGGERPSDTTMRDKINGFLKIDDTTLTLQAMANITVSQGERICLAVLPTVTQAISEGSDLYVEREAKDFLPQYNGAIEIRRRNYVYEQWIDEPGNNRVKLENLSYSKMPNTLPALTNVEVSWNGNYSGDFVILSPRNYIIMPTGTSETISAGGTLSEAITTHDPYTVKPMSRNPDIDPDEFTDNISAVEGAIAGFIGVDTDADELDMGGGYTPPATTAFGAAWYDANKAVGGDNNYCQAGACKFLLGFRTFFTLKYSGNGDGLTFAVTNGASNDTGSTGGDIEQSELLGYAGDSRTDVPGTTWLDGSGDGLQPPKMALEFDTITNFNSTFESTEPKDYCSGSSLKADTRNDPLSSNRDVLQYVYWGNNTLTIPCRNDDPSYDDNRHDAEGSETSNWAAPFSTNGNVWSKPVIGPNDTLYVATESGSLHAINIIDGTEKWTFPDSDPAVATTGDFPSDPALNDSGDTVYIAERDGSTRRILAIDTSDGTQKWTYGTDRTDESSPAVDRNGVVYIGASVGSVTGEVYAINPDGTEKWTHVTPEEVESEVIVDRTGRVYDGFIYVGTDGGSVLQFSPNSVTGDPEWTFATGPDVEVAPALSDDGSIVYALGENGTVYAINASNGNPVWSYNPGTGLDYHDVDPAVDTSGGDYDGTIYIMNSDQGASEGAYLSSVKADGSGLNWSVPVKDPADASPAHSKSSPAVGPDGTIYVGSDDNYIYAINPSDGSVKWRMNLFANARSSPTVGVDGTLYIGSDDNKVFAISNYALPRNRKDLYITSVLDMGSPKVGGEIVDVSSLDDWLKGDALRGPWAVRIEVLRSVLPNAFGNYEYTLRTWIRQCATEASSTICTDPDIVGTFFQDTRIQYDAKTPHITQTVELSPADQALFERFLFGFTAATAMGASQSAVIGKFQLSFIRPGDPVILADPDWP